jgi:hypothetical protein
MKWIDWMAKTTRVAMIPCSTDFFSCRRGGRPERPARKHDEDR